MLIYPQNVVIEEQGLRDGLQPETAMVPTEKKLAIIDTLVAAGIKSIQVTSFVNPRLIPQMADAEELCQKLDLSKDVTYSALVLNEKGVQRAADAGLKHVGVSISASDTHSRKNANASLKEAGERIKAMVRLGKQLGLVLRGGLQCVFGCRYEGRIQKDVVLDMIKAQLDLGVDELTLADSTGMAHPESIRDIAGEAVELAGHLPVYLHLHDTEGKGLANVFAGMAAGISHFETTLGGMGGCPFIKGASGNVSTEDLVCMLHQMGIDTGIDVRRLAMATRELEAFLGKTFSGKMHTLLARDDIKII
ncbi:MAG: hydroxymethylglutaryl-CoA lyase [Thermodesulfobacteriota bacterium]